MKIYTWLNPVITPAEYFVEFTLEEIRDLERIFPGVSSKCQEGCGFYYGFVDRKRKLFIPLKRLSYAFGGLYDELPIGNEELDIDIDFTELSWQEDVDMDLKG